jgi:tRNA nucleotidyltransferase (CCA-adding enzyme)
LKGIKPSFGLDFFCDAGLQNMFPEIGISKNLGKFLDCLASKKEYLNAQETEIIMFAGLLSSPSANPVAFLKKWLPVNILLKKVPALLSSILLLDLNDKSSLRKCALKAGGLKLPAIFKNVYDEAYKIGNEMGIWHSAPEPFITGQMLLDMGCKPGPKIGETIKRIFEMQLNGEVQNKEEAMEKLRSNYQL